MLAMFLAHKRRPASRSFPADEMRRVELLITTTAWMPEANSWSRRWKQPLRAGTLRSARRYQDIWLSKPCRASRRAAGRSIRGITGFTLPSLRAALDQFGALIATRRRRPRRAAGREATNTAPSASGRRTLQKAASGKSCHAHRVRIPSYRLSARQRSGGSVSQTSAPLGTAFSVECDQSAR